MYWFQGFGLEMVLVPIKLLMKLQLVQSIFAPHHISLSWQMLGGEERIGTESQVLLGCVGINYRGAFRSKVTVSLYWSNSEQNPAPNLCIDLDREFQKLSELCRSMIPI